MVIFINFLYVLMCATIFTVSHILITKLVTTKPFKKIKIEKTNLEALNGALYGVVALLLQVTIWKVDSNLNIFIPIISALATLVLKTWLTSIISIVPAFVFYIFFYPISLTTYISIGSLFAIIIFFFLAQEWLKIAFPNGILIVIAQTVFTTAFFTISSIQNIYNDINIIQSTILAGAYLIIFLLIIKIATRFVSSANSLSNITTYKFGSYYRYAVAETIIQKKIRLNRIKYGVYILIETIKNNDISHATLENNELNALISIEKKITNHFASVVAFNYHSNVNGYFLPVIETNPVLAKQKLESKLIRVDSFFNHIIPSQHSLNFKVGISIYGVHEGSLEDLERSSLFAIRSIRSLPQKTKIYNYLQEQKQIIDAQSVSNMDKSINLDEFEIKFNFVFAKDNANRLPKTFIAKVENSSEFDSQNRLYKTLEFNNWVNEFDRYFAMSILEKIKNTPDVCIILNYTPISTTNIDWENIIYKISALNLQPNQIILATRNFDNENILNSNIHEGKKRGFRFALYNYLNKISPSIQPDFIIYSSEYFKHKIIYNLDKIIFSDIATVQQLTLAKKNNAKLFSGNILQESENITESIGRTHELL